MPLPLSITPVQWQTPFCPLPLKLEPAPSNQLMGPFSRSVSNPLLKPSMSVAVNVSGGKEFRGRTMPCVRNDLLLPW